MAIRNKFQLKMKNEKTSRRGAEGAEKYLRQKPFSE